MTRLRIFVSRLRGWLQGRSVDRDLREEITAHLEEATDEYIRQGLSPADARRAAFRSLGGVTQIQEAHREARSFMWIEDVGRNFRWALRSLRRSPAFTATALLTLGLGIGATTAVFSVVYGVLLRPLPFPEAERLVALYHVTPASQHDLQGAATYLTYRAHGRTFEDIGLWNGGTASVVRNGNPEEVEVLRVTDGTLPLLGVRPVLGRLFDHPDDAPGAPLRVLLTYAYWRDAFSSSADVIGNSVVINTRPHEVIGVLPASFRFLNSNPELILPLGLNPADARTGPLGFNGVGRLKPGVTLSQAHDDVARMIPLLAEMFPLMPGLTQEMWNDVRLAPNVRPLSDAVVGDLSRPLWVLLGTTAIVLLMAWTNVLNLMLVRAEARVRECAVRSALGAGRLQIIGDVLCEAALLGLGGGLLGIGLAQLCVAVLRRTAPSTLPRLEDIGVDATVTVVALIASLVVSLVFGLVSAVKSRGFRADVLRDIARTATDPPGRHRTRNVLAVVQIGFALVLLVVSGLMVRTFVAMRQVQPGFVQPGELRTFDIAVRPALVSDPEQALRTLEQIAERVRLVPGVGSVGLTGLINLSGIAGRSPVYVEGRPTSGLAPVRSVRRNGVGYFETMGNTLVTGRTFTWTDVHEGAPVVVVSRAFAREYWDSPGDAIGKRIRFFADGPWSAIVGVVGDERIDGLNQPAPPLIYEPMAGSRSAAYVVRSPRAGTAAFARELQEAVWSVNPNLPLANMRTMADVHAGAMAQTSFTLVMLALSGGVALVLGLVGVYGVVSYIAAQRTREIGIRIALGADAPDVRDLFLRHGLVLTLAGLAVGLGAALLLAPAMSALLYGVGSADPVTYAGAATLLGTTTLLATYLPARRASRVDPIVALRTNQ